MKLSWLKQTIHLHLLRISRVLADRYYQIHCALEDRYNRISRFVIFLNTLAIIVTWIPFYKILPNAKYLYYLVTMTSYCFTVFSFSFLLWIKDFKNSGVWLAFMILSILEISGHLYYTQYISTELNEYFRFPLIITVFLIFYLNRGTHGRID
jgi:type II secretory pathway component PulF